MKLIKKIIKTMKKIFLSIWHFIDKFIVIPVTKFFLGITNILNKNGKYIEKWISNKNTLLFISLIIALVAFFIVDSKSVTLSETSAEIIYNQPVNYVYNQEAYVVEGLPETVDITLIGRKSDLYLAGQLSTHDVTIDLSDLKPGTHKVNLKYKQSLSSIDYKLDPSVATVIIYPKKSISKSITIDLLNKDKLDEKLFINDITPNIEEVFIKGAEHILSEVATVKALLDVNNIPNPGVGQIEVKDIPLLAYDDHGNIIDVEIVPSKIDATVTITSPQKEVPIKIIPKGNVVFGQAISAITSDINKVKIYGDETILDSLNYIPIEIDVTGLKSNKDFAVTIQKPTGVTSVSSNTINIKVTLEKEVSKEVTGVRIDAENVTQGLSPNISLEEASKTITVIVKGVESVIKDIDESSIRAYVDLTDYTVGTHEVKVHVEGNDVKVKYEPKTTTIKVDIIKP